MSLFITTVIFIVTLALSLGALFPSQDTDDPEAISTSMSGLFFTALALIYGGLSAWVLYLTLTLETSLFITLFVPFTCLVFIGLLVLTPKLVAKRVK